MIFVDVETQNFFSGADGVHGPGDLKISFVGAYDSLADKMLSFWEKDLSKLEKLLRDAELVVGYNSWDFDYGVLAGYFEKDPHELPSLDLMVAMKNIVGFRPKLDSLAWANLGKGKIGKGFEAVEYWERGELDKLEKYCLEDVRLTYEVWKVGQEQGRLKYYDQRGFIKETPVSWEKGKLQKVSDRNQLGLFTF